MLTDAQEALRGFWVISQVFLKTHQHAPYRTEGILHFRHKLEFQVSYHRQDVSGEECTSSCALSSESGLSIAKQIITR